MWAGNGESKNVVTDYFCYILKSLSFTFISHYLNSHHLETVVPVNVYPVEGEGWSVGGCRIVTDTL